MHVGKLNFINDYNDDDEGEKLNIESDSDNIHVHVVQLNFINDYKDDEEKLNIDPLPLIYMCTL